MAQPGRDTLMSYKYHFLRLEDEYCKVSVWALWALCFPPFQPRLVWPNQPPLKHAGDKVLDGEKWIMFYNWPAEQRLEVEVGLFHPDRMMIFPIGSF